MTETIAEKLINIVLNVRTARLFRKYTQEYLALKLNISQNAYSKIELGYTTLTLLRLMEIGEILEMDFRGFFKPGIV